MGVEAGEMGLDEGSNQVNGVGGDVVEVGIELRGDGGWYVSEGVSLVGFAENIERTLRQTARRHGVKLVKRYGIM